MLSFLRGLWERASVPKASPAPAPEPDPGVALVQHYESCAKRLPNGLIAPYLDRKNGVATIGWGNTYYADGKAVTLTDPPITQAQADALFETVYTSFKQRVAALLPASVLPRELGAFTSLAYNIGLGDPGRKTGFAGSTARARYLAGDKRGAAEAMEWWNKDEGVVLLGLQRRRRAERLVFEGRSVPAAISQAESDYPKK